MWRIYKPTCLRYFLLQYLIGLHGFVQKPSSISLCAIHVREATDKSSVSDYVFQIWLLRPTVSTDCHFSKPLDTQNASLPSTMYCFQFLRSESGLKLMSSATDSAGSGPPSMSPDQRHV